MPTSGIVELKTPMQWHVSKKTIQSKKKKSNAYQILLFNIRVSCVDYFSLPINLNSSECDKKKHEWDWCEHHPFRE